MRFLRGSRKGRDAKTCPLSPRLPCGRVDRGGERTDQTTTMVRCRERKHHRGSEMRSLIDIPWGSNPGAGLGVPGTLGWCECTSGVVVGGGGREAGPVSTVGHLAAEAVEGLALTLEGVDDVHGGDSLAASVLGVGHGVTDDVLEENLED